MLHYSRSRDLPATIWLVELASDYVNKENLKIILKSYRLLPFLPLNICSCAPAVFPPLSDEASGYVTF